MATNQGSIYLLDHGINLQQAVCDHIYQQFAADLPDLSTLQLFVPTPEIAQPLRQRLIATTGQQHTAIIGADISTFRSWVDKNLPLPDADQQLINHHARQLLILEALKQHPAHFRHENIWQVADSLLQLFDELSLYDIDLLAHEPSTWIEQLKKLYGITQQDPAFLNHEARLVYTLWQAWRQQLDSEQLVDDNLAYISRLLSMDTSQSKGSKFIFVGCGQLNTHEISWIKRCAESTSIDLFIQADKDNIKQTEQSDSYYKPLCESLAFNITAASQPNAVSDLISEAYHYRSEPLKQRIKSFKNRYPAAVTTPFTVFAANSEEHEARAIELQIRRWLLSGKQQIAVITENRKLARRIRALLERAGIMLSDAVGWSLSTTSAASVLERWLECIEQDFSYQPLLDLLKSPFLAIDTNRDAHLQRIYRFEQDIVVNENISSDINRYLQHMEYRLHRLQHWSDELYDTIRADLLTLQKTAQPLSALFHSNQTSTASEFLQSLLDSIAQLGITSRYENDAAGQRILQELTHMQQALRCCDPQMDWHDFRTWLGSALEQHHFSPRQSTSPVVLLNLQQSESGFYDAAILASADASHLPGAIPKTAFFNHQVRAALGLPDWRRHKQRQFYLFRRALQCADSILITHCIEKNEEWQEPSPWLQSLQGFYENTYAASLADQTLMQLLESGKTEVINCDDTSLPVQPQQPSPSLNADHIPIKFSASRHQRLINCPYQFFASDILALKPPEEIAEELRKSEYGSKVHSILEQFHRELPHILQQGAIDADRQLALKEKLKALSEQVFHQDLEDNFIHRGWLKRWLDHVDAYLNWQSQHEQQWRFKSSESKQERKLDTHLIVYGQIDRIDKQNDRLALIDYKTGASSRQPDVDQGEDVQLATYALLLDTVEQVEYLKLDEPNGKVQTGAKLEGDDLQDLIEQVKNRLLTLIDAIHNGEGLIANGSDDVCQYCQMPGLCRKPVWIK